jgi:membrane protein YqaA with SNARE-associated domain
VGLKAAAFLWGLAEATLFFIVPDVLLSAVALRERARALRLCFWALGGAMAGGLGMYQWGRHDPIQVADALARVPAVNEAMIERVGADLDRLGSLATFLGPLTGTPYKIYAALSPEAGVSLLAFLLVSIPARLIRFVLVAWLTALVARTLLRDWSHRARLALLLGLWTTFYAAYFLLVPWH